VKNNWRNSNAKLLLSRRSFLKLSALIGGSAALTGCASYPTNQDLEPALKQAAERTEGAAVIPALCDHNCWPGRCQIKAYVKDGVVVGITTDNEGADDLRNPQVRACVKGRSQRMRLYHPDRLKYPLKRVGERGEGKFERISWEEALDTIASEFKRIKNSYGNDAFYINYSTGVDSFVNNSSSGPFHRLLALFGGYVSYYGNYSSHMYEQSVPYMFGDQTWGNDWTDMANAKLIVLFGFNPLITSASGVGGGFWIQKAKERGAKVIVIDPRYSSTAVSVADEWIPIRPTTDTALVAALAYVMIKENLYDKGFMDKYCVGFDDEHLPEGIEPGNSYLSYVMGKKDGIAKTPQWAAEITGVPAESIVKLAREIAMIKPCSIQQGYGLQRHAYGEQVVRAVPILAAMTGNIGLSGGGPGLDGSWSGPAVPLPMLPVGDNPVPASISFFTWTEAIEHGHEMTAKDHGVRGVEKLKSDIKCVVNYAGNALINQHAQANKTAEILRDTSKCEFILVCDTFMTPSARFADILLPGATQFERNDVLTSNVSIGLAFYGNKCIEPLYECRTAYDICAALAPRLGIPKEKFTEGRSADDWIHWMVETCRNEEPGFPTYEEFKEKGVYKKVQEKPLIALADFVADPVNNPLQTPSGKIEIFSKTLWDMGDPEHIPAIPSYIAAPEGPQDQLRKKYPLQLIGFHNVRRVHSMFDNVDWLNEVSEQTCWMNPEDAKKRGIKDGNQVKVFNDRGTIIMPVKITPRIMPGVCAISEGGWFTPDQNGIDRRGCINTLTKYEPTRLSKGNPQHTNLVQIEKV